LKSKRTLLYRSAELLQSGYVAYGIGHQIDRGNDHRYHSPGSKKQIFRREIPKILVNTGLAQIPFETLRLPRHQHSDVTVKRNRAGLPHITAELAVTQSAEVISGIDGCHVSLREKISKQSPDEQETFSIFADTQFIESALAQSNGTLGFSSGRATIL
jgi:hypothetical protein